MQNANVRQNPPADPVSECYDAHRNRVRRYEQTDPRGNVAVTVGVTLHPDSPVTALQVKAWYFDRIAARLSPPDALPDWTPDPAHPSNVLYERPEANAHRRECEHGYLPDTCRTCAPDGGY
jgi:hypothetical protein